MNRAAEDNFLKSAITKLTSAQGPGDWVRANVPGIWQVVREIAEHYEPRYSLEKPPALYEGRLLVLKRLVDNKWKKGFTIDVLEESTLKPLSQADVRSSKVSCKIIKNSSLSSVSSASLSTRF